MSKEGDTIFIGSNMDRGEIGFSFVVYNGHGIIDFGQKHENIRDDGNIVCQELSWIIECMNGKDNIVSVYLNLYSFKYRNIESFKKSQIGTVRLRNKFLSSIKGKEVYTSSKIKTLNSFIYQVCGNLAFMARNGIVKKDSISLYMDTCSGMIGNYSRAVTQVSKISYLKEMIDEVSSDVYTPKVRNKFVYVIMKTGKNETTVDTVITSSSLAFTYTAKRNLFIETNRVPIRKVRTYISKNGKISDNSIPDVNKELLFKIKEITSYGKYDRYYIEKTEIKSS